MATLPQPIMDEQVDVERPVMFAPRRLTHANIFVGNLERSLDFYTNVCGLEDVGREPGIRAGFVSNGNTHHDVGCVEVSGQARVGRDGHVQVPKGRGKAPGMNHHGWEVGSEAELVAAFRRAKDTGLKVHRTVDHQISRSVYVFDPDGGLHEFYADEVTDWRRILKGGDLDLITGHWNPGEPEPSREPKYHAEPELRRVPSAVFHGQRIVHTVVIARNFPRMRKFFAEVAGLTTIYEAADGSFVCYAGKTGRYDLALFQCKPGQQFGLHHYSFEVESEADLDAGEAAWRRRGGTVEMSLDLKSKRSVFLRDPDGILVELCKPRTLDFAEIEAAPPERRLYVA